MTTVLGENFFVEPGMANAGGSDIYNFSERYLTASCAGCPLHITGEVMANNAHLLRAIIKGFSLPEDQMGLCVAGRRLGGRTVIHKFLIPNPRRASGKCTNPSTIERDGRVASLRVIGLLVKKQEG